MLPFFLLLVLLVISGAAHQMCNYIGTSDVYYICLAIGIIMVAVGVYLYKPGKSKHKVLISTLVSTGLALIIVMSICLLYSPCMDMMGMNDYTPVVSRRLPFNYELDTLMKPH